MQTERKMFSVPILTS